MASFLAPLLNGPLLDWNFRRVAAQAGITVDKQRAQSMTDFPVERARVPIALPMAVIGRVHSRRAYGERSGRFLC